jgi:hypothetical protein
MQDDKMDPRVAENAQIAAQQAKDKIDEMAKTTEYKVDEAVRRAAEASRAQEPRSHHKPG